MGRQGLLLAAVATLATLRTRAQMIDCTAHSECQEDEYCSHYTTVNDAEVQDCYPCVDDYGFTCSGYGDSIDGICDQCAEEEAEAGEGIQEYVNCDSSDACPDGFYCYKIESNGFTVQDCYPCVDSDGKTCAMYGDEVSGSCDTCEDATPTTSGCTTHAACEADWYCSSYEGSTGDHIVACQPCVDSWGYTCFDYADAVDDKCDRCAGSVLDPSDPGTMGGGECTNPGPDVPVAVAHCRAHSECSRGQYCSSFMGDTGCLMDCWACEDQWGLTCSDYGDAIDGSCDVCAAGHAASGAGQGSGDDTSPAAGGTSEKEDEDNKDTDRTLPAELACSAHVDCSRTAYCARAPMDPSAPATSPGQCSQCVEEATSATCETRDDSLDESCAVCAELIAEYVSSLNTTSATVAEEDMGSGAVAGVIFACVLSGCVLCGAVIFAYQKCKGYGDGGMRLRYDTQRDQPMPGMSDHDEVGGANDNPFSSSRP